jgi:hypothetical protein
VVGRADTSGSSPNAQAAVPLPAPLGAACIPNRGPETALTASAALLDPAAAAMMPTCATRM